MSVLSCFRLDFIEYLYKCDLKINTYENVNKGIVNGYWLFFHKNNDKFVTRIRYSFNEEKKNLYTYSGMNCQKFLRLLFFILYLLFRF